MLLREARITHTTFDYLVERFKVSEPIINKPKINAKQIQLSLKIEPVPIATFFVASTA